MVDAERREPETVALDHVAGRKLDEPDVVGQPADDPLQRSNQVDEAARPVDDERELAAAQRERLQHSGEAEHVVGMEVREVDLGEVD